MDVKFIIVNRNEIEKLKSVSDVSFCGYVYLVEWGTKYVKIGSTENPYVRIKSLISQAEKYGDSKVKRIALSQPHTNFRENEQLLHKLFTEHRKDGTELFSVNLDEIVLLATENLEFFEAEQIIVKLPKSRADYMKSRRHGKKTFSVLIDKEKSDKLDEKLKEQNKTKASWLEEQIDNELKK